MLSHEFLKWEKRTMVMLPVIKLGALAIRTLSKPIANRLKRAAGVAPRFRGFIIGIAQANHRFSTNLQRRLYGHATNVEVRPLNEERAVQAAADLIGELFIFTVAGAAVIYEVHRNARSEARKEELRRQELEALKQKDEKMAAEIENFKKKLDELEKLCKERGKTGYFNILGSRSSESNKPGSQPA